MALTFTLINMTTSAETTFMILFTKLLLLYWASGFPGNWRHLNSKVAPRFRLSQVQDSGLRGRLLLHRATILCTSKPIRQPSRIWIYISSSLPDVSALITRTLRYAILFINYLLLVRLCHIFLPLISGKGFHLMFFLLLHLTNVKILKYSECFDPVGFDCAPTHLVL